MNWPQFHHEAMATTFAIIVADQPTEYARQAAAAAWRELDRLETELSRYVESSDIARANRLKPGETLVIGESALECLLVAAAVTLATGGAFDVAYASQGVARDQPPFTLDPENHTLISHAETLHLDLGAVGKGYALDRMAAILKEWQVLSACLQSGGSTALTLTAPTGSAGWPIGLGEPDAQSVIPLQHAALSGSGIAVKGSHLIDPRTGSPASRVSRTWALAPNAALSDALSTAFFVMSDAGIIEFCQAQPDLGAAFIDDEGKLRCYGKLEL